MAVRMYTTPNCSYCHQLRRYLRERKVKFVEYDISRDERKAAEVANRSRQHGVPVLEYNGTIVVGFDRERIDRLIAGR